MQVVQRALLLTDLVDSTRLVESLGDLGAARLGDRHDAMARDLVAAHGGREIDKTDGFLVLFDEVGPAVSCAMAYHRALADLSDELGVPLRARAGVHHGSVVLRENPSAHVALGAKPVEVEGSAKPLAARVMSLAGAGQTLLTAAAVAALGTPPAGAVVRAHGSYALKGVADPVEVSGVGPADVPPIAPPDAAKAWRVVRRGDLWVPARDVPHTLPAERDAFVGRAEDLAGLARRVDTGARLVTVVGPGGAGKTRLVRRYAWSSLGDWPGGVWFAECADARDRDALLASVARGLQVAIPGGDPEIGLARAIAGRGRCLLVVDNLEQVVEVAGATVERWLDVAPDAVIVATSRAVLQVPGEHVLVAEPLPVDDDGDAVRLFVERARAANPAFAAAAADVGRLVRLLDGLPLAIELAAARTRALSVGAMVERMRDRFGFLVGGRRVDRQATLRAAIDWSWDLLTPAERAALAQVSVFEGGFSVASADAVLDLSAVPGTPPAVDVVQSLLDKSLLRVAQPGDRLRIDEPWFSMYVSVHAYAAEKLAASDALATTRDRHAAWFAAGGSPAALASLAAPGGLARLRTLAADAENVVAAARHVVAARRPELAAPLVTLAVHALLGQGRIGTLTELTTAAMALGPVTPADRARIVAAWARAGATPATAATVRAEAERALAEVLGDPDAELALRGELHHLAWLAGERDEGLRQARLLVDLARGSGRTGALGRATLRLADALADRADAGAEEAYREAVALSRDDVTIHGSACANFGFWLNDRGRVTEAPEWLERALAAHRETGHRLHEANTLGGLATCDFLAGRPEESAVRAREFLALAAQLGVPSLQVMADASLGLALRALGELEEARVRFAAARALASRTGAPVLAAVQGRRLALVLLDLGRVEEAAACADEAVEVLRRAGPRHVVHGLEAAARVRLAEGRPDAAVGLAQEALAHGRDHACHAEAHAACVLADALLAAGRPSEAVEPLAAAAARAAGSGGDFGLLHLACGRVALACGRADEARRHLERAEAARLPSGGLAESAALRGALAADEARGRTA